MKNAEDMEREIDACTEVHDRKRHLPFGGYPDVAKLMTFAVMITLRWVLGHGESPAAIIDRDYSGYYTGKRGTK